MKLALNMLVGTTVVGLGEALVLGERCGLGHAGRLRQQRGRVAVVKYKAPLLAKRHFPPAFSTSLLSKGLNLAVGLARGVGSRVSVTHRGREVVEGAIAAGLRDSHSVPWWCSWNSSGR